MSSSSLQNHNVTRQNRTLCFTLFLLLVTVGSLANAAEKSLNSKAASSQDALIQADRRVVHMLNQGEEFIKQKRYDDAITLLQKVINLKEDAFYRPAGLQGALYRSVRTAAERLIGNMPQAGRDAYELKYGAVTKADYLEAMKQGNPEAVAEVARKHFHTQAGYAAAYQTGIHHWDRANPLAAALCFERLQEIPSASDSRQPELTLYLAISWSWAGDVGNRDIAINRLINKYQNRKLMIAEREFPLPENATKYDSWLKQVVGTLPIVSTNIADSWLMFAGNAAREGLQIVKRDPKFEQEKTWSAGTVFDPTKLPSETTKTMSDQKLQLGVKTYQSVLQQVRTQTIPGPVPILIEETLLVRTLGNVRAIDVITGKRKWDTIPDETLGFLLNKSDEIPRNTFDQWLKIYIAQRLWGDATTGLLSSDGKYVYAVEDSGLAQTLTLPQKKGSPKFSRLPPAASNRLVAYHLQTGRRLWEIGGPRGEFEIDQAGIFFLGAPLPLAGRLYCLIDAAKEIQLVALNPQQQGKRIWTQFIATANSSITNDRRRRLAGTMVSYADGVMLAPTGDGAIVALNLSSRSLLWGYRLQTIAPVRRPGVRQQGNFATSWLDTTTTIVQGKVLLVPLGSNQMHCLNLSDGSLLWKKPLTGASCLSGVLKGKIVLAGSKTVQMWNLADGTPVWKQPLAVGQIAGRGLIRENQLLLPLVKSQLAIINLQGINKLKLITVNTKNGLGNLIGTTRHLISQNATDVERIIVP